jgi:transcriptional regulator with XRE-family HTH domain
MARTHTILVQLGTEIRRRRKKLGLSQAALAAKAGVHVNVIGRVERGIYNPTVLTLESIAKSLNASMVDLLRGASK